MIETLIIAAAASFLAPVARHLCEAKDETSDDTTNESVTSSAYESGGYGSERSSGERQTTLDEFGF